MSARWVDCTIDCTAEDRERAVTLAAWHLASYYNVDPDRMHAALLAAAVEVGAEAAL